ncbi:hypothetical protein CLU79DRAFT_764527, partial [Phycomyces nitens]
MPSVEERSKEKTTPRRELSELLCGRIIFLHKTKHSSREIKVIMDVPQSTIRSIIKRWEETGTTAANPGSGRPKKLSTTDNTALCLSVRRHLSRAMGITGKFLHLLVSLYVERRLSTIFGQMDLLF